MRKYESLYFDYQHHAFVRPPEMDGASSRHGVVIVGGGPVGLACALDLARHGVRSVVIEADDTVSEGSRAACISRRSMEILQQLGVIERFLSKALVWTSGRSFYRGKVVFELHMPHSDDERFYPMANLQQCYIEQFMVDTLVETRMSEIRWQSRVAGVRQHADHVSLTIDTPQGPYTLDADYVIAADGARSAMRELMGLKLSGTSYSGRYLIADIKMKSDHPIERRAWFDPPSNPGSTVLMHKQPDDIWRVDYQLREDDDADEELKEQNIRRRIQDQLDMAGEATPWELDWYSIYKAHCLCLDNYVQDRVIFVGDAAHLVPIFGVRGLNSGLADANNLGWKLAYVIKGEAPPDILRTYDEERREATQEIFREAGKSTIFMTPPTRGYRIMRDSVLSLALRHAFARPLINPRQSAPYDYVTSALNSAQPAATGEAGFEAGPRIGAPVANHRLAGDQGFLGDHLGLSFTGIYFCEGAAPDAGLVAHFAGLGVGNEPFTALMVTRTGQAADGVISDPEGRLFDRYGARPGTFYLVRPDGHICARFHDATEHAIDHAVNTALMRERATGHDRKRA